MNIGAGARSSHQMKATNIPADSTKAASIGADIQPRLTARVRPSSSATSTPVERIAPVQSKLLPCEARSDSQRRSTYKVAITPTRPKGMFRKNTARQCMKSTTAPPMAGPATAPTPTVVISNPMARPRSVGGKTDVIIAMPVPWVMAAPTPCRMRASSSVARLGASPAPAAPIIRMTLPRI